MKKPMPPPDYRECLGSLKSARFMEVLDHRTALVNGKYRHWDKLRHLKPPADLTHEEWWGAVKLARIPLFRAVPLATPAGEVFRYCVPDPVQEKLHKIDSLASGRIAMSEQVTDPETRDRYLVNSLMEEAITSSQLEGAATTRQVAADMIRSGRKPKDHGEKMILNNYVAMSHVRELARHELTPESVLDLHRMLTEDTLEDPNDAGRIQTDQSKRVVVADGYEDLVLHTPPPVDQLPARLQKMCEFANRKEEEGYFLHPIIRSIILHFWLAYDHPFADGNGRTARMLFYWSMIRHGYWLFEYISISRILKGAPSKYKMAYLLTETDDNDLTYFILYQLEVMVQGIGELETYLERKVAAVKSVEQKIRATEGMNHRQIALLSHALRHPQAEYSIKSHQRSHNVAYATARSDLFQLVEAGYLEAVRSGKKSYRYLPSNKLTDA